METPEKIYLTEDNPLKEWYRTKKVGFNSIEYTRTDAFIEKACEFLSKISNYNEGFIYPSHGGVIDAFVNNFKNYLKGE